jgi:hypothetical protein
LRGVVIGGRAAEIDGPVTTMKEIPFYALRRSAVKARMVYGRVCDWSVAIRRIPHGVGGQA